MISWSDTAIHAGIALALVFVAGFAHPALAWEIAGLVTLIFWVREALQHLDRAGIDNDAAKSLNPLRWGIGSQMELYAPAFTAVITAIIWTLVA